MTAPSREAIEALIDYLDEEAECEISSAGELTDLGKILRRHEVTARALLAQRERDEKVKVKPLEWVQGYDGPRYEYSEDGSYQIFYSGSNAETVLSFGARRIHVERFSGDVIGRKARRAAQDDYERRILSALAARDAGGE